MYVVLEVSTFMLKSLLLLKLGRAAELVKLILRWTFDGWTLWAFMFKTNLAVPRKGKRGLD